MPVELSIRPRGRKGYDIKIKTQTKFKSGVERWHFGKPKPYGNCEAKRLLLAQEYRGAGFEVIIV